MRPHLAPGSLRRAGRTVAAALIASGALAGSATAADFTHAVPLGSIPTAPTSGFLPSDVTYQVTAGAWAPPQGYAITTPAQQVWTFSRPVDLRFGVGGLDESAERLELPAGVVVESVAPGHRFDPVPSTWPPFDAGDPRPAVGNAGADASQVSVFRLDDVETLDLRHLGDGVAGPAFLEVTAGVPLPVATIEGPPDGSRYQVGDVVQGRWSCEAFLEEYSCAATLTRPGGATGSVFDGEQLPTDVPGAYRITVTVTDGLGQTHQATSTYIVGAIARLCRGTAVRTGDLLILAPGLLLGSANSPEIPCRTDYKALVNLRVPLGGALGGLGGLLGVTTGQLLQVGALQGLSADEPDSNGTAATASIAYAKLNALGITIELGAVESMARARLDGPGCAGANQTGYSHVANLKINGKSQFAGSQPAKLTLPLGLGAIHVNQTVRQGAVLTQRAVFIDLPGTSLDIALAESRAGIGCA